MDLEHLHKPIQPDEIEWRVQQQTQKGDKLIIVPYINNRCVMERFDKQFGWDGWYSEFKEVAEGFICRITVKNKDHIIYKEDGASRTNIEEVKGGVSDSMKRAAVQFGLGRGLYKYPRVFIETTDKYIPDWVYPRLNGMVKAINEGTFKDKVVILKPKNNG